MEMITWQEQFSVGVQEIDEQHKKIIEIINRLNEAFKSNQDKAMVMPGVLQELSDYAKTHFTTEEKYFAEFGYEKAEAHIEVHTQYRDKITELSAKYENGFQDEVFFEISNFLRDWWIWHINNTDKEYTQCFNEHGLK